MSAEDALARGVTELRLELPRGTQTRLMQYVGLLERWNRVYSLTAVRGAARIVTHHLLDSLAVLPHIAGETVLDVGSGAGLPGVPLALARPQARFTLLDSSQKKAAFLRQAAIELRLDNVRVVCERAEGWRTTERFDVVISRAFSNLRRFVELAGRFCAPGGTMGAMKALTPSQDLESLPAGVAVARVVPLTVPGLRAARQLVLMHRT